MTKLKAAISLSLLVGLVSFAGFDAYKSGHVAGARTGLTIIAPASAGGGWDTVARELQQAMRENSIVSNPQVLNVPGAAGTIGLNQFLQLKGSDDVILVTGTTMIGGIEVNGLGEDLTETNPLRRLADDYLVVTVPASSPYKSMGDLIAAWKQDPESVSIGGGSLGGSEHTLAGLMASDTGVPVKSVNYIAYAGGGEVLTSMLSKSVDVGISSYVEFGPQIESGSMRALALSAPEPVDGIDIPTLHEAGLDVDLVNWRGVVAPPGLSDEELDELEAIVSETTQTDEWQSALTRNQWVSTPNTTEEFAEFIREDTERITEVIRESGL